MNYLYLTDIFVKQCNTVLPLTQASIEAVIREAQETGVYTNNYGFALRNCVGQRLFKYIYYGEDGIRQVKTILEMHIYGKTIAQAFGEMIMHDGYEDDDRLIPVFRYRKLL